MRAAGLCLVAALAAGDAIAAEFGIGLSAKSDNGLLYVPIDVSPRLRVEPHVRYSTGDSNAVDTVPPTATLVGEDTETLELGAGIFGVSTPKESLRVYYGGRAGYLRVHTELNLTTGGSTVRIASTDHGYRIAPTLGFEYVFNAHFTLGGEATYFYQRLERDSTQQASQSGFESDRTGTETFLILRYFF